MADMTTGLDPKILGCIENPDLAPGDSVADALIKFFRDERFDLGNIGDNEQWSPIETAINLLRKLPTAAVARKIEYTPGEWYVAKSIEEMQAFYLSRLPAIREAARELGYAIGLHGSTTRDLDLMAMQWREGPAPIDDLANAIMKAACGFTMAKITWEEKPMRRIATSLPICWPHWEGCNEITSLGHIDLSVRSEQSLRPAQAGEGA